MAKSGFEDRGKLVLYSIIGMFDLATIKDSETTNNFIDEPRENSFTGRKNFHWSRD